jgi:hypothetical protein
MQRIAVPPRVPVDPLLAGPLRSGGVGGTLSIYSIGSDGTDDGGSHTALTVADRDEGDTAVHVTVGG